MPLYGVHPDEPWTVRTPFVSSSFFFLNVLKTGHVFFQQTKVSPEIMSFVRGPRVAELTRCSRSTPSAINGSGDLLFLCHAFGCDSKTVKTFFRAAEGRRRTSRFVFDFKKSRPLAVHKAIFDVCVWRSSVAILCVSVRKRKTKQSSMSVFGEALLRSLVVVRKRKTKQSWMFVFGEALLRSLLFVRKTKQSNPRCLQHIISNGLLRCFRSVNLNTNTLDVVLCFPTKRKHKRCRSLCSQAQTHRM